MKRVAGRVILKNFDTYANYKNEIRVIYIKPQIYTNHFISEIQPEVQHFSIVSLEIFRAPQSFFLPPCI